jgi:hypothetical protein
MNLLFIINKVHELTVKQLATEINSNSISELFDFPEEVKTACTQYLQYFMNS